MTPTAFAVGYVVPPLRGSVYFLVMTHSFRCGLRCAAPPGLCVFSRDDPQLSLWATLCLPSGALCIFSWWPTAFAVGYVVSPLRGFMGSFPGAGSETSSLGEAGF